MSYGTVATEADSHGQRPLLTHELASVHDSVRAYPAAMLLSERVPICSPLLYKKRQGDKITHSLWCDVNNNKLKLPTLDPVTYSVGPLTFQRQFGLRMKTSQDSMSSSRQRNPSAQERLRAND